MANDPNNLVDPRTDTESVVDADQESVLDPDLEPYDESVEQPKDDPQILFLQKRFSEDGRRICHWIQPCR